MPDNIMKSSKIDDYIIKEAEVIGSSGVKHRFILLHSKEEDIAVEFSNKFNAEPVLAKLIVKCRDSGISHAMLVFKDNVNPGEKIYKMAEENGIKIMSYSEFKRTYLIK